MKRIRARGLGSSLLLFSVACFVPGKDRTVAIEPVEIVYAAPAGTELKAFVFSQEKPSALSRRAAIVLFHGGGWIVGEPQWAFPRARRFAERGMVAVAAQYRLSDQKEITPIEAMADARAVIRWMRTHADSLGIDPGRIAAYGWSAGAHLAASAAIFDGAFRRDHAAPDALVLISPAVRWPRQLQRS
jgi:acetyl esterase/lipase